MAQKETETGPSLELPSLFGRKKRRGEQPAADQPPAEPTTASTKTAETIEPDEASETSRDTEPTEVLPAVEAEPSTPTAHTPAVTPAPVPTHPPAEPRSAPVPPAAPEPGAGASAATGATAGSTAGAQPAATSATAKPAGGRRRRAEPRSRTMPEVAAATAAFLVGAGVGLAGCVLTWLGLQGCELVTGTDSCGGPGLLVLIVILILMVLLGAAALRALRVPDAGNVSFLGVGILAVVALVFLAEYLYDPWMFVIVPVVTAVSYAVAQWITTLYAEDVLGDDDMPRHDIR